VQVRTIAIVDSTYIIYQIHTPRIEHNMRIMKVKGAFCRHQVGGQNTRLSNYARINRVVLFSWCKLQGSSSQNRA